jgi:hypothetical protein
MYNNYELNAHQMQYGNHPNQGKENMYPQAVQSMPNQMYPTGVQGAYQPMYGDIKHQCRKYMNYHVQAKMQDGSEIEGIITDMDENNVTMLVPEEIDEEESDDSTSRQYGYGRRRFRRFRRLLFPLLNFLFFRPYPYYYPYPYPYYPYPY